MRAEGLRHVRYLRHNSPMNHRLNPDYCRLNFGHYLMMGRCCLSLVVQFVLW